MGPRSPRASTVEHADPPRTATLRSPRAADHEAGAGGEGAAGALGGDGAPGALRAGHAPQALAGDLVPAARGDGAARGAGADAAGARLRGSGAGDLHGAGAEGGGAERSERARRLRGDQEHPGVCLPADGAAVCALGAVRGGGAAAGHGADRGLALPGDVRGAAVRAGQRPALLRATTSSGARWRSRCCTCPCCATSTSGPRARSCASPATSAGRCWSARARTSARSRTRCGRAPLAHEVVGFVSLRALPANGLRSLGTLRDLERILARGAGRRGDHRGPRLPPGARRWSWWTAATAGACGCGSRPRRWRS